MSSILEGKTAVVTGAGKGIGRASAIALAREGVHIVAAARTESDLDALAAEIGGLGTGVRVLVVPADVSQEAEVNQLAQAAFDAFGQVDILVNNAGVGKNGTIATLTTADYDWIMNTNMRSTWLCVKAFMPPMIERQDGSIIFVSSVAGMMGLPNESIYCRDETCTDWLRSVYRLRMLPQQCKGQRRCTGRCQHKLRFLQWNTHAGRSHVGRIQRGRGYWGCSRLCRLPTGQDARLPDRYAPHE